jgi:peroxiredoxin
VNETLLVGMTAPGFSLPDLYGRTVSLQQYCDRPVVLSFMRHLGCLLSRAHLAQLRQQYGRIQHLGGEVIVVSFEEKEGLQRLVSGHKLPFVILLDPQKEVYNKYGMIYKDQGRVGNLGTAIAYMRMRLSGYPRQQAGTDTRQMGGDVVIDRQGVIRFIYRSQYPHDLPDAAAVLKVMTDLGR